MTLRKILWLNLAWALMLIVGLIYFAVPPFSIERLLWPLLAVLYLAVTVLALRGWRLAVVLNIAVALLEVVNYLPNVVVNFWMLISGHELYKDSPATIIIVIFWAVLFAIPATVLCVLYAIQWRQLWALLRSRTEQTPRV